MTKPAKQLSDARVVATSLGVSVSDVLFNLVVGLATGSAVMLAQALQGWSDLITGGILYLGVKRSRREADGRYQFGYGREIFFWVLIAGIFMFMGTGGLSVYLGYQQFVNPEPVTRMWLAFGMLVFGLTTNLYSLSLSIRRLHRIDKRSSWRRQLVQSSIVETKATLLIDFMGTAAAFLGIVALLAYLLTGNVRFDGVGSIAIGLAMMVASTLLISDVRDFIIGRGVDRKVAANISKAALSVGGIRAILDLRTMYLGSDKLLVIIEVHVEDGLSTDEIETIIDKVKATVKRRIPQTYHIQVEVETPDEA